MFLHLKADTPKSLSAFIKDLSFSSVFCSVRNTHATMNSGKTIVKFALFVSRFITPSVYLCNELSGQPFPDMFKQWWLNAN